MRIAQGLGCLCLVLTCACSSNDDADESFQIGSSPLSGKVGGSSWSFVAGETDANISDAKQLWADLYAEPITSACGFGPTGSKNHVILNIPPKAGDYKLSNSLTASFVIEGDTQTIDNLGATRGRLVVEEVTDSKVRGKAHVVFDADNEIDGTFEISRCK
jgi:hypothetical protein